MIAMAHAYRRFRLPLWATVAFVMAYIIVREVTR
jgi:hypothetical protein